MAHRGSLLERRAPAPSRPAVFRHNGTVRWLDLLVIAVYMAALVLLGLRFARRQTSTERYFVAKRSIPGWAAGMSLLATLFSSVTFIACRRTAPLPGCRSPGWSR
jgi:Na+(H+)/acetate symporter ActP